MILKKVFLAFIISLLMTTFVFWMFSYNMPESSTLVTDESPEKLSETKLQMKLPRDIVKTPKLLVPKIVRTGSSRHPYLKRVDVKELVSNSTPEVLCPTVRFRDRTFQMCIYSPADDLHVSANILKWRYWEPILVGNMMDFLAAKKDLEFIDIGANLGAYTLPALFAGYKVIAVEPNLETLRRLSRSVVLGDVSERLTLLHNAVSNGYAIAALEQDPKNPGDTYLITKPSLWCVLTSSRCVQNSVQTVTLNDLIPLVTSRKAIIKIDAQRSEIKIFDPITASKFFKEVDVQVVQMEWEEYRRGVYARKATDAFINFFYERNYTVHDTNFLPLGRDWENWPNDIYLMKPKTKELESRNVGVVLVNNADGGEFMPESIGIRQRHGS